MTSISRNSTHKAGLYVCFLICLGFIGQHENFSLIWRRHHYRWRASKFELCSTLMAIGEWGYFRVPHLLWHGASVFNIHLRRPVTLTLIAERLEWSCHYLFYDLDVSRLGFEHPAFRLRGQRQDYMLQILIRFKVKIFEKLSVLYKKRIDDLSLLWMIHAICPLVYIMYLRIDNFHFLNYFFSILNIFYTVESFL